MQTFVIYGESSTTGISLYCHSPLDLQQMQYDSAALEAAANHLRHASNTITGQGITLAVLAVAYFAFAWIRERRIKALSLRLTATQNTLDAAQQKLSAQTEELGYTQQSVYRNRALVKRLRNELAAKTTPAQ